MREKVNIYSCLYSSYNIYVPNGGRAILLIPAQRGSESIIACDNADWRFLQEMRDVDRVGFQMTTRFGRRVYNKKLIVPIYFVSKTIVSDMRSRDKFRLVS